MTVDMSIDLWQTQQCAIKACEEIMDEIRRIGHPELITPSIVYWEKVKKKLESK